MKDDYPTAGDMLAHIDDGQFEDLEQIRDTAVKKAVQGMMLKRSKACLRAVEAGHSGIDFVPYAATQAHDLDPDKPIQIREQARSWRGDPPDAEDYPDDVTQVNRVDFRDYSEDVLREKFEAEIDRLGDAE